MPDAFSGEEAEAAAAEMQAAIKSVGQPGFGQPVLTRLWIQMKPSTWGR